MAAIAAGLPFSILRLQPADRARFFNEWLRRIAPDTHQDQASGDELPVALAAWPPQKNVGAAARPMG